MVCVLEDKNVGLADVTVELACGNCSVALSPAKVVVPVCGVFGVCATRLGANGLVVVFTGVDGVTVEGVTVLGVAVGKSNN